MKEQSLKKAMESFEIESKAIANIADYLDVSAFKKAVEVLCTCNKIITCASGTSGIAAKKMAHSLCCVERMLSCHLQQQFMVALVALREDDAMIMVSRGGAQ